MSIAITPALLAPHAARFQSKVKPAESGCWLWTGSRSQKGYGQFSIRIDGKAHLLIASRVAYVLHGGQIPAGFQVMHACDNPPCCNPNHLSVGTNADNIRDAIRKGRSVGRRRVLTDEQEAAICRDLAIGISAATIGEEHGIHWTHVYKVGRRHGVRRFSAVAS